MRVTSITLEGEITPNSSGTAHVSINFNDDHNLTYKMLYTALYKLNSDLVVVVLINPDLQKYAIIYSLASKQITYSRRLTWANQSILEKYKDAIDSYKKYIENDYIEEYALNKYLNPIDVNEHNLTQQGLGKFVVKWKYIENASYNLPIRYVEGDIYAIGVFKNIVDTLSEKEAINALNEYLDNLEQEDD